MLCRLPGQHEVGVETIVENRVVIVGDRCFRTDADLHVVGEAIAKAAADGDRGATVVTAEVQQIDAVQLSQGPVRRFPWSIGVKPFSSSIGKKPGSTS